jgi:putative DNA primase/helicase
MFDVASSARGPLGWRWRPRVQLSAELARQAELSLTDAGNAVRFVGRHGHEVQYCHAWKQWLVWDGRRWTTDSSGATMEMAKDTASAIFYEASNASNTEQARDLGKHASRSLSLERLRAMLALAQSAPGIPVTPDKLDQDPWLFNVENGTIDLRTGSLSEHKPADLITKLAPVEHDPAALRPTWDAFLDRVTDGNRELTGYLQRAVGYSLTGSTRDRALWVLYGIGRNGKSTFVETLHAALGDYAKVAPVEMLMAKRYEGGIPNDVAAMKGARLVSASEAEEGRRLAESKVKQLTGADSISARFLHGEYFTYRPQFKLWLTTNHKPEIRGTDKGIWDRIRLIPFSVRIPEAGVDPELPQKLKNELPGILAWAVQGCLDWQRHGLAEPAVVGAATAGYQQEMDVLAAFLEDRCVKAAVASVPVKDLYAAYQAWCEENGEYCVKQRQLTERLKERGVEPGKDRKARLWLGLRLRDTGDIGDANSGVLFSLLAPSLSTSKRESRTSRTSPDPLSVEGRALIEDAA